MTEEVSDRIKALAIEPAEPLPMAGIAGHLARLRRRRRRRQVVASVACVLVLVAGTTAIVAAVNDDHATRVAASTPPTTVPTPSTALVVARADGSMAVVSAADGGVVQPILAAGAWPGFVGPNEAVRSVSVDPVRATAYVTAEWMGKGSFCQRSTTANLDLQTGAVSPLKHLRSAWVSPDGRSLAAIEWTDTCGSRLVIRDLGTGAERPTPALAGTGTMNSLRWSIDSRRVVVGTSTGAVVVFDTTVAPGPDNPRSFQPADYVSEPILRSDNTIVAIRPGCAPSQFCVIARPESLVELDGTTGATTRVLAEPGGSISGLEIDPSGTQLAFVVRSLTDSKPTLTVMSGAATRTLPVTGAVAAAWLPENVTLRTTLAGVDWDHVTLPISDCAPFGTKVAWVAFANPEPGTSVAVVAAHCDAGAGSPPDAVFVYDSAEATASGQPLQTLLTTADNWLTSQAEAKSQNLSIPAHSYSSDQVPRCCPDVAATLAFVWQGSGYKPSAPQPPHQRY